MLRIPSTEGRSVCLCWAKSKPKGPTQNKGPKGSAVISRNPNLKDVQELVLGLTEVFAFVGRNKNLKDLKDTAAPWPKHGLSTEPVPVSAYVGSSKNLKDLKDVFLDMQGAVLALLVRH